MNEPELIDIDWQLFRADGDWHDIGHGIEVMAYPHMAAGALYMRAKEPLPRGSGQGPDLALTPLVEHEPGHQQQADQ